MIVFSLILLRIMMTRNKKIIVISIMTGLILLITTTIIHDKTESVLPESQNEFNLVVKKTSVKIDGQFLRFTGLLKNKNNQSEEVVVSYKFSTEKEKRKFEEIGVPNFLKINGVLELPKDARNFHQFSYSKYLYQNQIYWTLKAEENKKQSQLEFRKAPFLYRVDHLRSELFNWIDRTAGGLTGAYIKALLFADKRELSASTLENYKSLGIIHLLSISGLHIQFLIILIEKSLLRIGLTKETTAFILVCTLPVYGLFAGFGVSVFRAIVQSMIALGYLLIKRTSISLDNWAITMVLALLIDPFQIYSAGFHLSYLLSCFMIILSGQKWIRKLPPVKMAVTLNLLISLVSIPVLSYHFYEFSWIVIILNLVFIPIFSIVLLPLLVFTFVMCGFLSFFSVPVIPLILSDIVIRVVEKLAETVSKLSSFTFVTGRLSIFGMMFTCLGIGLLFVYFEKQKTLKTVSFFIIGITLLSIGVLSEKYSPFGRVVMLDVGQGDAFLIKEPWGRGNYLIDTGGLSQWQTVEEWTVSESPYSLGTDVVIPAMKSFGIGKLDQIILTHADTDHVGALKDIINGIDAKEIIATKETFLDPSVKELMYLFSQDHIKLSPVDYDKTNLAGPDLNVLYPSKETKIRIEENKNNASLVLFGQVGQYKWLFTGDLEAEGEKTLMKRYPNLKTDILKVAHHGSRSSTQESFLDSLSPLIGWISSGENNVYGHPNNEILARLENRDIEIYRTDQQGAVQYQYVTIPFTNDVYGEIIEKIVNDNRLNK